MENDRIKEIIGQIKGIVWELENSEMDKPLILFEEELRKVTNELLRISDGWKEHLKRY